MAPLASVRQWGSAPSRAAYPSLLAQVPAKMGALPIPDTPMNRKLTAKQYRKLVELAYLGEWMINAQHDPDFHDEEAQAIVQTLLADHPQAGVKQDAETREYFMSEEWIEQLYDKYVLDYDDHVFWDELTERLAQRDLAKERGVSMDDINRDDDLAELRPYEDRYHHELEDHGLDRLEIVEDYS